MDVEPKKSKHGGSPESGLVHPGGLEELKPAIEGGKILEPAVVVEIRKEANDRTARALQLERRRIGLEVLKSRALADTKADVTDALGYADELIAQTGGGI